MTSPEGDPLARDLFGADGYNAARPRKQEFLPWHRPRKQFVRREQWVKQARKILVGRPESEPVRYLGLPGEDLIDLRYIHQELCADGRPLTFLGFNRAAQGQPGEQIELNISRDEVRRLPNVDSRSRVIGDDFRSIARPQSVAWQMVQELGPFEIVNIDLCDGLFSDQPLSGQATIYDAIAKLFGAQRAMTHPWLFLVTSRVGRHHVELEAADRLLKAWFDNLERCEGFKDESTRHLLAEASDDFHLASAEAAAVFQVVVGSICKWVLGLAVNAGCEASFPSSISYRVESAESHDDLVSLAIRIEPIVDSVIDRAKLSAPPSKQPDECKCAKRIPARIAKTRCADLLLAESRELHNALIAESEGLLELCRYDINEYRTWLST
jgi:hypothetical protein